VSAAVTDVLARFVVALDDHDWEAVTACLAERVRRDYRSLTGAEPDEPRAADLVAEWRSLLAGLDGHQHLLGPSVVEVDGDTARASTPVIGTHELAGDPGSPWAVGGTYRFELCRDGDGGWRIAAIRLDVRWQTGDASLLTRAAS